MTRNVAAEPVRRLIAARQARMGLSEAEMIEWLGWVPTEGETMPAERAERILRRLLQPVRATQSVAAAADRAMEREVSENFSAARLRTRRVDPELAAEILAAYEDYKLHHPNGHSNLETADYKARCYLRAEYRLTGWQLGAILTQAEQDRARAGGVLA